jgi:hypothetical protein
LKYFLRNLMTIFEILINELINEVNNNIKVK